MDPVFKTFKTLNGYYVFDRSRNAILKISEQEFELLNQNDRELIAQIQKKGYLNENRIKEIKHLNNDDLEFYLNNNMEKLIIQLTQNCNLKCSYCPYNGTYENRSYSNKKINLETIKKSIDYFLAHSQSTKQIAVAFYGGEPLLEMDLLKSAVEYIRQVSAGRDVYLTLTTNGTLLNDDNIEYFQQNEIYISVSLDGSKEFHDANRVFHNGKGSFDVIMEKLFHIKQKYPVFFSQLSINSVINTNNNLSCSIEFFNAEEVLDQVTLQMNKVSELNALNEVDYNEEFKMIDDYEVYKSFLNMLGSISDHHVSRLYQLHKGSVNIVYKTLRPFEIKGKELHVSGQCMPGVSRLMVDVEGNFYPCERVSEKSKIMNIGNVEQGIDVEKSRYLLNIGKLTEQDCINCFATNMCKMCIAWVDGDIELSVQKKRKHCDKVKKEIIKEIRLITILKELGYNFEGAQY